MTRFPRSFLSGLVSLLAVVVLPLASQGAEEASPIPGWQVGESVNYTTGTYGTGNRTTTLYLPLTMRRLFGNGDLALVIPFVTITSNCGVTLVSGVPLQTNGLCPQQPSGKFPTRVTNSGLGDVLLRGRYTVLQESGVMPSVALTARVKIPTADRDRGLGTGEWDEGLGLTLTKSLTKELLGFADAGYTFIGNPPGSDLRNQWSYDIGLGYILTSSVLISVYYEEARALVAGFQNPRDILTSMTWAMTSALRFTTSFEAGLSTGAPEYAVNVGLSIRF